MRYYILKGHKPVGTTDIKAWTAWYETADRSVAKTDTERAHISTVFLGTDHRFVGRGLPILFETLVFGGELDEEMERYTTWSGAEIGHAEMVERVRKQEAEEK